MKKLRIRALNVLLLIGVMAYTACNRSVDTDSEIDMPSGFELESGFEMELIAAEPLISDPVDMEIDENGRLYVVEMHGYPLDVSGSGKVKLLSDSDGDGVMDKSRVFADSLVLPTGIMRWKKGVLVTDAPDVLYLEDTDGDGRADRREVVLTGFALSNPQHNFNSPMPGLDNWIYLANEYTISTTLYRDKFGDKGRPVYYPERPEGPRLPVNAAGLSVRFRPDRGELELLSSRSQFGQTFDAWGRHLLVSNSNHIYQEVIAARYLERNPALPVADVTQPLSDHGNAAEVFPITENPDYQLLTNVGVFTSASGLTAYLGGAFPEGYGDNTTFVTESVSNLVHADRLKPKGASFSASRIQEKREFLASTDSWFRPVNLYVGPEGGLYVVDYYRQYIEHPEWMSEEVVESGELYNGIEKGRIYRIKSAGAPSATWSGRLELGAATDSLLVAKLADPNIWWRRHAQRLLIDRNSEAAVPALKKMAQNREAPMGRLHSLWTLQGLGRLSSDLIESALRDPEPGVRENAIKLAEIHLAEDPGLVSSLLPLQSDSNARVRFQLLCTLGFLDEPRADKARRNILFMDINDPWIQTAALTAKSLRYERLLEATMGRYEPENPAYSMFVERLSAMAAAGRDGNTFYDLLKKATSTDPETIEPWQSPVLNGIARGLSRSSRDRQIEREPIIDAFFAHPSDEVRRAALEILEVIGHSGTADESYAAVEKARAVAADSSAPAERRALAIRFMALYNPSRYAGFLKSVLIPGESSSVQLAALNTLSSIPDETVCRYVLERWPVLTPEIRDAALQTFLASRERVKLLLDAVESGKIQADEIDRSLEISLMAGRWPRETELMSEADFRLRDRARALLREKEGGARSEVVDRYRDALEIEGDWEQGRALFRQYCASCHQRGEAIGVEFGPDLASIRNRRPASILTDILDPQLSIADGYDYWVVKLNNGETMQGVIASETPNAITLVNQGGHKVTVARSEIESLEDSGMSAMPPGMEKQISLSEMADLLAYLKGRLQ